MSDLPALLERVRTASGPDRELDGDLAEALRLVPADAFRVRLMVAHGAGFEEMTKVTGKFAKGAYQFWYAPHLTSSIADILGIVRIAGSRDYQWHEALSDAMRALSKKYGYHMNFSRAEQLAELPLAILSALLAALIDKEKGG